MKLQPKQPTEIVALRSNRQKITAKTPLGRFLLKHDIDYTTLGESLRIRGVKFSSGPTISRFVHGTVSAKMRRRLNPPLFAALISILQARGIAGPEINDQLSVIFEEGEYQPMISQRLELSPQAVKFFGLAKDPFTDPPQTRDEVFISPAFRQVIDRVVDAVRYQGFVSIIGPIGSGKSTLRALIEDQIENESNLKIVWPEFFDMTYVSPMSIAEAILNAFDAPVPRSSVKRGNAVKSLLSRLYKNGTRVAIGIDEGHRLNDRSLSSLKNFLEMNSGGFQRYLGVIIFAQPVLVARLREPLFQEIYERIVPVHMPDFSQAAADYLRHRLSLVGADLDKLFDAEAVDLISSQATTPLSVGNIANEALKISMEHFNEKRVIGSAIKTKMFFENRKQGFALRKAS